LLCFVLFFFFFFQAEDGIRDLTVTGVQTCALPILAGRSHAWEEKVKATLNGKTAAEVIAAGQAITEARRAKERKEAAISVSRARSEERRVGKECRLGWARSR